MLAFPTLTHLTYHIDHHNGVRRQSQQAYVRAIHLQPSFHNGQEPTSVDQTRPADGSQSQSFPSDQYQKTDKQLYAFSKQVKDGDNHDPKPGKLISAKDWASS
jgi:hypothetical protein